MFTCGVKYPDTQWRKPNERIGQPHRLRLTNKGGDATRDSRQVDEGLRRPVKMNVVVMHTTLQTSNYLDTQT